MLEEGKSLEQVAAVKGVEVGTVRRWQREDEGLPKGVEAVRSRGRKRRMVDPQKVQR
jgi:transposase